ncbi:Heavy metal-associated domain superfamily [Arabidopsis suecica]|uniref:Heavy metal-associated domain superfamily n=1 Tax=Arabidopsis suecica TaxID=45249 RepID=A0A8T2B441_ARASU|nr:Heavy metal-associated domain superfamily [Arabidopsis suecica]
MEDLEFPICILKMNLQCCEDFPCRIKKLLRKVKGVYAITIDPVKGLILVSGTAEPSVLIKAVAKIGQSPQLYAYEKDPATAKTRFRTLLKRYATNKGQDEPSSPAPVTATNPVETCPAGGGTFRGFGYPGPPTMMQMPAFTLPPRMGPPGWLAPAAKPRLMVKYEEPKVTTRKPPAPYPFDFYENLGFPPSDSLFNYFSDENAQPCTIM